MNKLQKTLVQESFTVLAHQSTDFTKLFYARLFELNPSTRALFHGDIDEQGHSLVQTLHTVVLNLDQPEKIIPPLQLLGLRHTEYGVEPGHYEAMGPIFLWSLGQILGDSFTVEVEEAWRTIFGWLVEVMQEGQK